MKYIVISSFIALSACSLNHRLSVTESERIFQTFRILQEQSHMKYDAEYIEDCFYHELDCYFE
jgi:hypothetical protein